MYELVSLVKRNLKLYLRDRMAVFFSLLSSIILLVIYVLFLGNSVGGGLESILTANEIKFLVYSNMLSGILVLNTITIPLGVLGTVVTDMQNKQLDAFLVTPVKKYKIILGYYISSYIITLVISIIIWFIAILLMGNITGIYYGFNSILYVILLLPVFVFISTSIMILVTTFIPSVNAFGAISGIFGSIIGFVSGIYIPLSSTAPKILNYVSSIIPFTHMNTVYKSFLLQKSYDAINLATNNNSETLESIKDSFGAKPIGLLGFDVPSIVIVVASLILAGGLIILSTHRLNAKMRK